MNFLIMPGREWGRERELVGLLYEKIIYENINQAFPSSPGVFVRALRVL